MRVDAFDFELPEARIALRPARPRDAARLLDVDAAGGLTDRRVRDLPACLAPGDLLVVNDTRVLRAALSAERPAREPGGAPVAVEINLHAREGPDLWRAFARPGKRLRAGDRLRVADFLTCEVVGRGARGEVALRFDRAGGALDEAIALAGAPPLPPYIVRQRAADAQDADDYQTVYARAEGSVAAPTAGLHFTDELLARLAARGVGRTAVTLHVGAGTFLPVASDTTDGHRMHEERFEVSEAAAEAIARTRAAGGRVGAVGTTVLRTLEAAGGADGVARAGEGATDLFITPGFRFRVVDVLMTNFHLPRSTLFMLVSAFMGLDVMRAAYAHAIASEYRFYSYGDATLLHRAAP